MKLIFKQFNGYLMRFLYSFWSIYLCGGSHIEDINGNLKHHLKNNPFVKVPSYCHINFIGLFKNALFNA